jgi:hypothetical protein
MALVGVASRLVWEDLRKVEAKAEQFRRLRSYRALLAVLLEKFNERCVLVSWVRSAQPHLAERPSRVLMPHRHARTPMA